MEQKTAGFWIRALAIITDGIFAVILSFLIASWITNEVIPIERSPIQPQTEAETYANFIYSVVFIIIFTGTRFRGSLGKLICGIQVTNEDGTQISIPKSIGRYFSYLLSILPIFF